MMIKPGQATIVGTPAASKLILLGRPFIFLIHSGKDLSHPLKEVIQKAIIIMHRIQHSNWGEAPNLILYERGRKKDFFIQIQSRAIGHGGNNITDSAFFGMILVITAVHFQFDQLLIKDFFIFEKIAV